MCCETILDACQILNSVALSTQYSSLSHIQACLEGFHEEASLEEIIVEEGFMSQSV